MLDEVKKAPLPILHHMIDIWTDKGSGRKFLGVHVSHVDANFELKDTLLSVSDPSGVERARKLSRLFFFIFRIGFVRGVMMHKNIDTYC